MVKTRKLLIIMMALILFFINTQDSLAGLAKVRDDSGILKAESVEELQSLIDNTESKYDVPIFIYITEEDLDMEAQTRADDLLFNYVGKDQDGLLLYVNMNTRDYHFTLSGRVLSMLDDKRQIAIEDILVDDLKRGDLDLAAINFVNISTEYISGGEIPGNILRPEKPKNNLSGGDTIAAALAGAISFFIARSRMRGSTNPVPSALVYKIANNSVYNRHYSSDKFLRKNLTSRKIPKTTNFAGGSGGGSVTTTHKGSGGGTFSGRGGKF